MTQSLTKRAGRRIAAKRRAPTSPVSTAFHVAGRGNGPQTLGMGTPESHGRGTDKLPESPTLAAMVVAGGIVAAATASFGPPGAIAAAMLTPGAERLVEKAAAEWRREGQRKAAVALSEAADDSGTSVEHILEQMGSHPSRLALLAEALNVAARTSLDAKVRMLGSALASGALAEDDARIDEQHLRVTVLRELEAPHLKVLEVIDTASHHSQGMWTGASERALMDTVRDGAGPRSSGVLQPILRVLDRNGLIYQSGLGEIWDEHLADDIRDGAGTNEWSTTIFGRELLHEYRQKGGRP